MVRVHLFDIFVTLMNAEPAVSRIFATSLGRFYALLHYLTMSLYILLDCSNPIELGDRVISFMSIKVYLLNKIDIAHSYMYNL